jgi:branched-chain amino acid transport system substrate-binding protein
VVFHRSRFRRLTLAAVVGAGAAAAAGCGTRLPDQAFAPVTVAVNGSEVPAAAAAGSPVAGPATGSAPAGAAPTAAPGNVASVLPVPAGSPVPAGVTTSAPAGQKSRPVTGPTSAPAQPVTSSRASAPNTASDRGVTPTAISVGNIVTAGGPFGPDQFSVTRVGAAAYFAALNAAGGVNGRAVNFVQCTDGSGTTDAVSQCAHQLIDTNKVFAFVANNVFQYGGADYVNSQDVPDVAGEPIDQAYYKYPHLYTILGDSSPRDGVHAGYSGVEYATTEVGDYYKARGVAHVGVVYYDQTSSQYGASQIQNVFKAVGVPITMYQVNLGLPNFSSTVANMKNDGVDLVADAMDANGNQKLCQAMESDSAFISKVKAKVSTISTWTQQVGQQFAQTPRCRSLIEVTGKTWSYADPGGNDQVAKFRAAIARYFPTYQSKMAEWMLEGWASADIFTTAVRSCGADLTRTCIEHWLNSQVSVNADGLMDQSPMSLTFIKQTAAQALAGNRVCLSVARWSNQAGTWQSLGNLRDTCYDAKGFAYQLSG